VLLRANPAPARARWCALSAWPVLEGEITLKHSPRQDVLMPQKLNPLGTCADAVTYPRAA